MKRRRPPVPARGFALTACLIVLVLLSIMIVAFMSSVRTDRGTSSAFSDIARVNLLAEGAVAVALDRTATALAADPGHAEAWEETPVPDAGGTATLILPVVLQPPLPGETDPRRIYLVSTPERDRFPANVAFEDLADLDPDGQLGLRFTGPFDYRAPWVEVRRDPAAAPDPVRNPVVARFAYWVEDETVKVDYGVTGNDNAEGGFRRGEGARTSDIDLGALPLLDYQPLGDDPASRQRNAAVVSERFSLPYLEPKFLNRAAPDPGSQPLEEVVRFYGTVFSFSNELSSFGRRRVNLNALIEDETDPGKIRAQVDSVAEIIQRDLPEFGQRFYPALAGPDAARRASMYVTKIATNIRDYIDRDAQPTILDATGSVLTAPVAGDGWPGDEPPRSLGKEAAPYLTEYAWTARELSWQRTGPSASYRIAIDQYLEFSNPTTTPVTLPASAKLTVTQRPAWKAGSAGRLRMPDLTASLAGLVIPPGQAVVVTTDPEAAEMPDGILQPGTKFMILPVTDDERIFAGATDEMENDQPILRPESPVAQPPVAQWSTSAGPYDLYPHLAAEGGEQRGFTFDGSHVDDSGVHYLYAAALSGNVPATVVDRTGDPRSLSEPLALPPAQTGEPGAVASAFRYTASAADFPGSSTLGRLDSPLVEPGRWPDPTPRADGTAGNALAFIADQPLISIGQLGDIYDPARESAGVIEYAYGGGRTLAIGQPERRREEKFSPGWSRSAWRLTDIFAAAGAEEALLPATHRGKINLNGVLRDDGTALRAVLRGLSFGTAPRTAPALENHQLTPEETDAFVDSVRAYIAERGPFMERGELSEISFFDRARPLPGGTGSSTVPDRTREEIFRRVVELVTTRSCSFTVHVVAETVRQAADGSLTTRSRARRSIVYRFDPVMGPDPAGPVASFRATPMFAWPSR